MNNLFAADFSGMTIGTHVLPGPRHIFRKHREMLVHDAAWPPRLYYVIPARAMLT
ncbi:hypothetical protein [Sphingobium yanoikuyae]|uniref:Uncharacterized protein n=1 Tax=Sphingobium yanoikuyae TaxID=13690 RepID=A0A9X7YEX9_SPHYA|nr:hypothetical protein [Sphingobium yanoikuyae]QNG47964.1 hypothetical protein H3V42_10475 [Sphingobium yanoikuyae]